MSKKLPWIKFYTSDWLSNYDLQMCSDTAQALWVNLICVMCNSPERGRLVENDGQPMSMKRIVFSVRKSEEVINAGLEELKAARICDIDDKGVIYSSRIVNEDADRQAEAERKQKYEETHKPERSEKRAAKRNGKSPTRLRQKSDKITTEVRQESDAVELELKSELELELDKRERSKSPAPGGVNPPPVDNSAHSAAGAALSLIYQNSSYRSEIEALANLIETTTTAGECNGIGESERRNSIYYQSEAFSASDSAVWFNAMTEAISCAQPGTREHVLVTAIRKYPDGILDSGNVSRSEELIRLTAQKPNCGACSKALAYIHGKQGKTTPPPSNSPGNEEEDDQNNLF